MGLLLFYERMGFGETLSTLSYVFCDSVVAYTPKINAIL